MAFSIRKALGELMGKEQVTDEDLRRELDELKIDQKLEGLMREGHLGADPETQQIARAALKGEATPEQLEKLMRAPKPVPANTQTVTPPTGPAAGGDPVEAAIQQRMAQTGEPYHVAAGAVASGGTIKSDAGGTA